MKKLNKSSTLNPGQSSFINVFRNKENLLPEYKISLSLYIYIYIYIYNVCMYKNEKVYKWFQIWYLYILNYFSIYVYRYINTYVCVRDMFQTFEFFLDDLNCRLRFEYLYNILEIFMGKSQRYTQVNPNLHPKIKFTMKHNFKNLLFLDILIKNQNN